ncbi:hypothetical protein EVAR_83288_1 [Eumeta japonica]|uniref:Uncharacterized protein n=1 Tax=Eumeta variegata TaxID=151549 RepID=A0A4C1XB44_EUMVA|nr:hypothetical protein EVAR_83288_1 [Eumeta japonica]
MLESIRKELPESRSEMVNDLDLQEDVTISPYTWTPHEDSSSFSENTWASYSLSLDRFSGLDLISESSLPVSHAMTDSEIDCGKYRRNDLSLLCDVVRCAAADDDDSQRSPISQGS